MISFRPSLGAWVSYRLGTENQNLPAFVALSPGGGSLFSAFSKGASSRWSRPTACNFRPPKFSTSRKEPESIREEYGSTPYANGCLLARRPVESGVRCVQVHYGPGPAVGPSQGNWTRTYGNRDGQGRRGPDPGSEAPRVAGRYAGGLGRGVRAYAGFRGDGRDHNPYGFTMFMAGSGFKPGLAYGGTDEFGFKAVDKPVSIHDIPANILHQLGLDHEKLIYRYAGRDFRLTDVYGKVVRDLIG